MEGFGYLRAEDENRQSRPNHLICFGWGNSASQNLSESETVSPTIKATRSGEPAIVVLNDQGGSVMDVSDKAACLRAQDHGHPPIICGLTNRGYESGEIAGAITAESGMHNTNYVIYPGVSITNPQSGSNPKPDDPCPTLVNDSRYYLVGVRKNDR